MGLGKTTTKTLRPIWEHKWQSCTFWEPKLKKCYHVSSCADSCGTNKQWLHHTLIWFCNHVLWFRFLCLIFNIMWQECVCVQYMCARPMHTSVCVCVWICFFMSVGVYACVCVRLVTLHHLRIWSWHVSGRFDIHGAHSLGLGRALDAFQHGWQLLHFHANISMLLCPPRLLSLVEKACALSQLWLVVVFSLPLIFHSVDWCSHSQCGPNTSISAWKVLSSCFLSEESSQSVWPGSVFQFTGKSKIECFHVGLLWGILDNSSVWSSRPYQEWVFA